MGNLPDNNKKERSKITAIALISGGLDSALAVKIMQNQGIRVSGIHFDLPWGNKNIATIQKLAELLGIPLYIQQLGEDFLQIVKNSKYGYGTALNPCLDCHIYMIQAAGRYMRRIGADFVFTGEVLGQRPMSQHRQSLNLVEEQSELKDKFLRPLSAGLLEPTRLELEGVIDRNKLLSLSGRSRKEQLRLAGQYNLKYFSWPAGGCLLTDRLFAERLRDLFRYGYRDLKDITLLKWGRHFRISADYKIILGRDENENNLLMEHAHLEDHILEFPKETGPSLVLQGKNPDTKILALAAGFIQYFSKFRTASPLKIICHQKLDTKTAILLEACSLTQEEVLARWIR